MSYASRTQKISEITETNRNRKLPNEKLICVQKFELIYIQLTPLNQSEIRKSEPVLDVNQSLTSIRR